MKNKIKGGISKVKEKTMSIGKSIKDKVTEKLRKNK